VTQTEQQGHNVPLM